jgi:hypothetical protein
MNDMETNLHNAPSKGLCLKSNAIPFAIFTEFFLDVISAHMCACRCWSGGMCIARTDVCGYMFHSCFLHFNIWTPCETLILPCLKVLIII